MNKYANAIETLWNRMDHPQRPLESLQTESEALYREIKAGKRMGGYAQIRREYLDSCFLSWLEWAYAQASQAQTEQEAGKAFFILYSHYLQARGEPVCFDLDHKEEIARTRTDKYANTAYVMMMDRVMREFEIDWNELDREDTGSYEVWE